MGKQNTSGKTKYRVYYGVDSNAALQPQYAPVPERERHTKKQTSVHKKEKQAHKRQVRMFLRVSALAVCIAAMGIFVLSRNAQIYKNTKEIRSLAKEKSNIELMIRTAEKDCSVGSELNSYFEIAEDQLALTYPEDGAVITVNCIKPQEKETPDIQESENIYDTVLDWVSSLERRIKSWA